MKNTQHKRIVAFIIDALIVGVASKTFENLFSSLFVSNSYTIFGIDVIISMRSAILFYAVYFILFDLTNHGNSVGKILMKIKVQTTKSDILTRPALIKRTALKLISIICLPISALVFLIVNGFTLHDYAAKTITNPTK